MPNANVTPWIAKTALPIEETPKTLDGLLDAVKVVDASGALSYRAEALFLSGLWEAVKPTSDKVPYCKSPEFVKGTPDVKDGFRSERSFFRYLAKQTGRTEDAIKQDALRAKALYGQSIVTDEGKVSVYRMAFSLDGVLELCAKNDWILKNAAKKAIQCFRRNATDAQEMFREIADVDASDVKEMAEIVKDYFPPTQKTSKGRTMQRGRLSARMFR